MKHLTTSKLKKELWKVFTAYIKKRDDHTCFTCGARDLVGSNCQGGHFITGATCTAELYFDEKNVHTQCYHCNINLSGNWVLYEAKMIQKYGQEEVDALKLRRTREMGIKKPFDWYLEKIEHYKELPESI